MFLTCLVFYTIRAGIVRKIKASDVIDNFLVNDK